MYGVSGSPQYAQNSNHGRASPGSEVKAKPQPKPEVEAGASEVLHRAVSPVEVDMLNKPLRTRPRAGLCWLADYPLVDLPRLLVDGVLLERENGISAYEKREPGCLESLIKTWGVVAEKLKSHKPGEPLAITKELILELHSLITAFDSKNLPGEITSFPPESIYIPVGHTSLNDLLYLDLDGISEVQGVHDAHCDFLGIPEDFLHERCAFALFFNSGGYDEGLPITEQTMKELFRCRKKPEAIYHLLNQVMGYNTPEGWEMRDYFQQLITVHGGATANRQWVLREIAQAIHEEFNCTVRRKTVRADCFEEILDYILEELNTDISVAVTRNQFLEVVGKRIAELQQLHPFKGGNGRTFTMLMQYLLMAYGFPPATLEEPNVFSLFSQARIDHELKVSLENTRGLINQAKSGEYEALHGFTPDRLDLRYRHICREMKNTIGS